MASVVFTENFLYPFSAEAFNSCILVTNLTTEVISIDMIVVNTGFNVNIRIDNVKINSHIQFKRFYCKFKACITPINNYGRDFAINVINILQLL